MTTYSPAAPRPRFGHLRAHLGTYVAGAGVTAALTAGALVAFLSVATFVAFKDFPFGASSEDAGAAYLESGASAAPISAAIALGAARGAVAEDPVGGPDGASGSASSMARRSDGSASSAGSDPDGAGVSGKDPSIGGPANPGISSPPPDVASPPIAVPSLPATSGPTTDTVRSIDNTLGTNLSEPTRRVTRAVDGVSTGALDRVGRAAGRPGLGDQVGGAVSGVLGR